MYEEEIHFWKLLLKQSETVLARLQYEGFCICIFMLFLQIFSKTLSARKKTFFENDGTWGHSQN